MVNSREINAFLGLLTKPNGVFLESDALSKIEGELGLDFEDFIKAQLNYKICNLSYKNLMCSLVCLNEFEVWRTEPSENLIKGFSDSYKFFIHQMSIVGIWLHFRYNIKLRPCLTNKGARGVLVKNSEFESLDNFGMPEVKFTDEGHELKDYINILLDNDVSFKGATTDADLKYLEMMYEYYKIGE